MGLHHLGHVLQQQHEHQRVDQHANLGRLALSVGDEATDHRQLAGQSIGHGVGNQEESNERSNLGHWYYILGKKLTDRIEC